MSALNASVVLAARGDGSLGDIVNNTVGGWFFTFGVIAVAIIWLSYRWVTRPFRKKDR